MRRFFIKRVDISGLSSVIKGSDANHIKNVLRLKPGHRIELFDGTGYEYEALITGFSVNSVEVSILGQFCSTAESPVQITVAQALLKERKMDGLIRQLTELGVTGWFPFLGSRSVPKPDENRISVRRQRWEKIAKEALKQCKRGRIPKIGNVLSFEDILKLGSESDLNIVFWEDESKPLNSSITSFGRDAEKILIVLGPEGGFTPQEIEKAKTAGFVTAALGPRILRAETAAVAACSIVQYLFGDMGENFLTKA